MMLHKALRPRFDPAVVAMRMLNRLSQRAWDHAIELRERYDLWHPLHVYWNDVAREIARKEVRTI